MIRLMSASSEIEIAAEPDPSAKALWIETDELSELTGWKLAPEGLCKDDVCVPLTAELGSSSDGSRVDVLALWRGLERPVLHDEAGSTVLLGEAAADRAHRLASLEAPDFTLPDLEGHLHSLSDHRGKKVLLATWASW
jgi:hypothetical protein